MWSCPSRQIEITGKRRDIDRGAGIAFCSTRRPAAPNPQKTSEWFAKDRELT
jgi:hypothetical protein